MTPSDTPLTDALAGRAKFLGFTHGYWMLNGIEMFERLAYYLVRSVVAIYIMQADDPNGLHLTAADKGTIYAFWFAFQSILPTFTGLPGADEEDESEDVSDALVWDWPAAEADPVDSRQADARDPVSAAAKVAGSDDLAVVDASATEGQGHEARDAAFAEWSLHAVI